MSGRKITQADISSLLGVSQATVSMALNGSDKIPPSLRRRIVELAQENGYRPSGTTRANVPENGGAISLALSENLVESYLPMELLRGIQTGLRPSGYRLNLLELHKALFGKQRSLIKTLRSISSSGLLLDYTHNIPQEIINLIHRYRIPHIWINVKMDSDCVYPDDYAAGQFAVNHLVGLGHRRIAFFDARGGTTHFSEEERYRGYCDAMQANDCDTAGLVLREKITAESRLEALLALLRGMPQLPSAIFCYGDSETMTACAAALKLGLEVPRALSIIGIHDRLITQLGFEITTLQVPFFDLGRRATELLFQKIRSPEEFFLPNALPFIFHPGTTVGAYLPVNQT